jgi:DNA polymerase
MVLGEAPGGVEMAQGRPFVGQSGELLRSLLKEAGLRDYYLSNIAKHQPPKVKGKQTEPDKVAIEACAPFLRAEWMLVRPAKVILLGKTAAKLAVEGNFSMKDVVNTTRNLNKAYDYGIVPALILYHPAHFLYNRTAPWIQKQISEWKRAVRMFLGDRPPEYRIEKVRCETHG